MAAATRCQAVGPRRRQLPETAGVGDGDTAHPPNIAVCLGDGRASCLPASVCGDPLGSAEASQAVRDLQELQADGTLVVWPVARASDVVDTEGVAVPAAASSEFRGSQQHCVPMDPELAEALEDFLALQASGARVVWPSADGLRSLRGSTIGGGPGQPSV